MFDQDCIFKRVYFNPRTRVECDTNMYVGSMSTIYFNPRTRVECDIPLLVL